MARHRRKSNRIKLSVILIGVLLIVLLLFVIITSGHNKAMIPVGDREAKAPDVTAKAALLYSMDLDDVMYSKNADTHYEPFSITKLVTCYIAANELDMNKTVRVSKNAANDSFEGSTMKLVEGEKVTVEQLLYGALILSGNDAATALAETVSGDIDSFVDKMNETVEEWGCDDTHFMNPTGWSAKNHYTTANDLLIIAQHTFEDETISKIAFTKKYKMPATNCSEARVMKNHIPYARKKGSGVLGGKSGFWSDEDCTVCLEYNKDELSAILILLRDTKEGRSKDCKKLLKFAHKVTPGYIVDEAGADTGKVWIKGGKHTHVKTELAKTVHAYPKRQSKFKVKAKIHYDKVAAPLAKGAKVGTYEVYVSGNLVATRDVLLSEDVEKGLILSNILIADWLGITIVVVILAIIAAIVLLRRYNKKKAARRRAERMVL